ncbi:MAG: ParB/RepB/Spo0J family partition protein [Vicinamibacterales bacterium]
MREFRELSVDLIDESDNIRRSFSDEKLQELSASIRQHGILKPLLVRPNGERFTLIDGWRRLSAAKAVDQSTVPVRIRNVDENEAEEEMIIANLHHEDVTPLDEAMSYQRLLDKGRTVDELAARLGKSKRYIYQVITLNRLIPEAQDLLAKDILPLNYAMRLTTVPPERQSEGLDHCFRPLFGKEDRRRDQLEPLAELNAWIEKSVRLDPHTDDAKVLLPELADQVAAAEQERDAGVLAVSTLYVHNDKSEPKPILVKSWKPADGKNRCPHARPAVIALGEGQGTFLNVCIAKKTCQKHWGKPKAAKNSIPTDAEIEADAARKRQEAQWARQREAEEQWRTVLRPRALQLVADRTAKLPWSRGLIATLLAELSIDGAFTDLVGRPQSLPTKRYPHAIAVALALRHSWRREDLVKFARRLGVTLTSKDLRNALPADAPETSASCADETESSEASVR